MFVVKTCVQESRHGHSDTVTPRSRWSCKTKSFRQSGLLCKCTSHSLLSTSLITLEPQTLVVFRRSPELLIQYFFSRKNRGPLKESLITKENFTIVNVLDSGLSVTNRCSTLIGTGDSFCSTYLNNTVLYTKSFDMPGEKLLYTSFVCLLVSFVSFKQELILRYL